MKFIHILSAPVPEDDEYCDTCGQPDRHKAGRPKPALAPAGDLADAIAERDANSLLACAYGKQMVKLEAERDALRVDAARYRWLRDVGDEHWTALTVRASKGATQIDATIDAAREPK